MEETATAARAEHLERLIAACGGLVPTVPVRRIL